MKRGTNHTAFAAALSVAAELERRCYHVSITLGNTPKIDLLATTEEGKQFAIQVKGISDIYALRIQKDFFERKTDNNLFLFIVVVPKMDKSKDNFQFFILTHEEAKNAYNTQSKNKRDGSKYKPGNEGLGVRDYKLHRDRWDKLPTSITRK